MQSLTINPKGFSAVIKALKGYVSTDLMRRALSSIKIEPAPAAKGSAPSVTLTATDDVTLAHVTIEAEGSIQSALLSPVDVDRILLACKHAGKSPTLAIEIPDHEEGDGFPDYARVIPARPDPMARADRPLTLGFNLELIERAAPLCKALGAKGASVIWPDASEGNEDKPIGERFWIPEPLRLDVKGSLGSAVVVVMGMRL